MKEHPILFSAPMVCAILAGNKTQTRRVIKPQPSPSDVIAGDRIYCGPMGIVQWCPYARQGNNKLWVRETWCETCDEFGSPVIVYRADNLAYYIGDKQLLSKVPKLVKINIDNFPSCGKWKPSIFMPRWAARTILDIVNIRIERLQDISEEDAIAEGIYSIVETDEEHVAPTECYKKLWEFINGPGSWEANPFVWVIEFKRV